MNPSPCPMDRDLAELQGDISRALRYWLHQSIAPRSFHKLVSQKYSVSAHPLRVCLEKIQQLGIGKSRRPEIEHHKINCTTYAEVLATVYQQWEELLSQKQPSPPHTQTLPLGGAYTTWLKQGGDQEKYQPVRELYQQLQSTKSFYLRAIVHGSIPTLDDQEGFSDMDVAFVIKSEVLKNREALMALRTQARRHLLLTYSFDPFMHHGPYYLAEMDYRWYSQPAFPTVLFTYGLDLIPPSKLAFTAREDRDSSLKSMALFHDFFTRRMHMPPQMKNRFELEWVLGSTMILPSLFLQQLTGEYIFKRDTFSKAEGFFTEREWAPVHLASQLRSSLSPRSMPGTPIIKFAEKAEWPGLIQRTANHLPANRSCAQKAFNQLGRAYPQNVVTLIEAMQQKLKEHETPVSTV